MPSKAVNSPRVAEVTAKVVTVVQCIAQANEPHKIVHASADDRAFFDCVEPPALSFQDYTRQLSVLGRDDVWLAALILASRFCAKADVPFNAHAVHRLMLTAYTVASKLYYDLRGLSKPAAFYGSVGLVDMHRMERAFLNVMDWNLYISADEYAAVAGNLDKLEAYAQKAMLAPGAPYELIPADLCGVTGPARTCDKLPLTPKQPGGLKSSTGRPARQGNGTAASQGQKQKAFKRMEQALSFGAGSSSL